MNLQQSARLLERARTYMPGGVSSPVRAFRSVGGTPPFIERAKGAHIYDVDGNEYIDYVLTWGPAILGHADDDVVSAAQQAVARGASFGAPTDAESDLVEMMIERVPGLELVRLVNSGTEACMSAVRVARGVTGRDKIVKFAGCYHGHADAFLVAAGSGALTFGEPNSPGVTAATAADTLIATFNDAGSVAALFGEHADQIACVIVEPICGNTGCIPPMDNFLRDLRALCTDHGAALILDEVMTGFRVAPGGAAEVYGVTPDLYCFGKVLGGGFPLAAYGGSEHYMRQVSPDGPIYQAGTLSGNPVAVAAGRATLAKLDAEAYAQLERAGERMQSGLATIIERRGLPLSQHRVGAMFGLFFHSGPIRTHGDVKACDFERFNRFFHAALRRGVYLAPSQYEAGFLSLAHTDALLDETLHRLDEALGEAYA